MPEAITAAPSTPQDAKAGAGVPPSVPAPFVIPKDFKDKIKVNGQEVELSYEELKARAMKAEGAEERFKYANQVLEAVKKNPVAVLQNPALGVDIKKVAFDVLKNTKNITEEDRKELSAWFYENIVKPSQMEPKEREALDWKTKAEQLEAEKKERMEAEAKAKAEEATKGEFQRILSEIAKEIPTSGLPFSAELKSPNDADLVRRIGRKMQIAIGQGRPMDVKGAIALVKQDLRNEHNSMARMFNEDNLHEFYDQDVMEKFNKAMLKKFKAAEKEKEKELREKERDETPRPAQRNGIDRQASREADKLIRKISTGRF